jgi:hypothetical protein
MDTYRRLLIVVSRRQRMRLERIRRTYNKDVAPAFLPPPRSPHPRDAARSE